MLHEPIPPDPREDVALSVSLDGDLRPAIPTPHGLVAAPDPARPFGTGQVRYSPTPPADSPGEKFRPDRDTRRPDVLPYDDPFTPSTAPFKRLSAYDSIDANYTLSVRDAFPSALAVSASPEPQSFEEQFYADMVVDLAAARKVRIPSVGPGTRVLRARAGVGTQDVPFSLSHDGAENWFIEGDSSTRARLVMELAVPRASFGGDFGNASRAELLPVPPLPPNVQSAAATVSVRIGVNAKMPPRDAVAKMVAYFRAFQDSDEQPAGKGDIYLDLALAQKGVCRHRAFAFMVTSLYLGIPTRMVTNEAHAWVEVFDGRLWRRVDLGGAGRTLHDPLSTNVPHEPPADPFAWPQGSQRGDDLADRARRANGANGQPNVIPTGPAPPKPSPNGSGSAGSSGSSMSPNGGTSSSGGGAGGFGPHGGPMSSGGVGVKTTMATGPDERPYSTVTMGVTGSDAHRGAPLKVKGQITADGDPCGHVGVEIFLRSQKLGDIAIGTLATDERGNYDGAIVVPSNVPLGDYDAFARTYGDARCGRGQSK